MIRHDKPNENSTFPLKPNLGVAEAEIDYKDPVIGEIRNGRKIVVVDKDIQQQVVNYFMNTLRGIIIEGELLITTVTPDLIIVNPKITLDKLREVTNDKTLSNYDAFIRNFYSAKIDDMMDYVFGEKVTCINEVPYSIVSSQQKPNVVTYDFLN